MRHTCRRSVDFQFPDRRRPVSGNPARFLRRAPGRVLRFPSGYALLFLLKFPSDAPAFCPLRCGFRAPGFPPVFWPPSVPPQTYSILCTPDTGPSILLTHIRSSGRKRLSFCFCHSCLPYNCQKAAAHVLRQPSFLLHHAFTISTATSSAFPALR